jgi:hypothetical protein
LPKIRFTDLPRPVWEHLLERVAERKVSLDDLRRLQDWVKAAPEAPAGDWYKDFGSFILCGSGEMPKTVLTSGMGPFGMRVEQSERGRYAPIRYLNPECGELCAARFLERRILGACPFERFAACVSRANDLWGCRTQAGSW